MAKWLVAYWCFYNVGTASILSERPDKYFWDDLRNATIGTVFPRGTERRHFRGLNALKSIADLASRASTAFELIESLFLGVKNLSALDLMLRVRGWNGFGPWIAFKVADMLERLGMADIKFSPSDIFSMFDSPAEGAILFHDNHGDCTERPKYDKLSWTYAALSENLSALKSPPNNNRPINIQEIETVLCKYKSTLSGHYHVGKDVKEIRHALLSFATCKTSQRLLKAGKDRIW